MTRRRKYSHDVDNNIFIDFLRARAQANFRGEGWEITEQEYFTIWSRDRYLRKGRAALELCMTRQDPTLPWTIKNAMVVTRRLHFQIRSQRYFGDEYWNLYEQAVWRG